MNAVTEAVVEWVKTHCSGDNPERDVAADTQLLKENVMDSVHFLNLVTFLESKYRIQFEVDQLIPDNFNTPSAVANLVEKTQSTTG